MKSLTSRIGRAEGVYGISALLAVFLIAYAQSLVPTIVFGGAGDAGGWLLLDLEHSTHPSAGFRLSPVAETPGRMTSPRNADWRSLSFSKGMPEMRPWLECLTLPWERKDERMMP